MNFHKTFIGTAETNSSYREYNTIIWLYPSISPKGHGFQLFFS